MAIDFVTPADPGEEISCSELRAARLALEQWSISEPFHFLKEGLIE